MCVCVCESTAESTRGGQTETRVGAGCPLEALLPDSASPPTPTQGVEQRGRRLWAPQCLTGSDGVCLRAPPSVSQAQTLLLHPSD